MLLKQRSREIERVNKEITEKKDCPHPLRPRFLWVRIPGAFIDAFAVCFFLFN